MTPALHIVSADLGDAADGSEDDPARPRHLITEPGISPLKVNVDTRDGIVTLFGTVETQSDKSAAERALFARHTRSAVRT